MRKRVRVGRTDLSIKHLGGTSSKESSCLRQKLSGAGFWRGKRTEVSLIDSASWGARRLSSVRHSVVVQLIGAFSSPSDSFCHTVMSPRGCQSFVLYKAPPADF